MANSPPMSFGDPPDFFRLRLVSCALSFVFLGAYTTLSLTAVHHLRSIEHLPRRTYAWSCAFIVAGGITFAVHATWSLSVLLRFYRWQATMIYFNHMFAVMTSTMCIITLLSDSLLIYRFWIIWDRSRYAVLPASIMVLNFVLQLITIGAFVNQRLPAHQHASQILIDVSISLSLTLNTLLAIAAITRLLQLRSGLRNATRASGNHYLPVVRILALNAVLWTACSVTSMALRLSKYSLVAYSVQFFVMASSPLFIFLHLGKQRPQITGAAISHPSMPSSSFWARPWQKSRLPAQD